VRKTRATIRYLAESDFVTRRFVSAGVEHSTGEYEDHAVAIRDARAVRDASGFDTHGRVGMWRGGVRTSMRVFRPFRQAVP